MKIMATIKSKTTTKTTGKKETKPVTRADAGKKSGNSKSLTTTNHDEIKAWVEKRKGTPSTVKGTDENANAGILRIDFPGYSGEDKLEEITWEEFFQKFDEGDLQFLYQTETADGKESRFSRFISK